jgi:hypothetical protein
VTFHLGKHKLIATKRAAFTLKLRIQVAALGMLTVAIGTFLSSRGIQFLTDVYAMPFPSGAVVVTGGVLLLFAMTPGGWLSFMKLLALGILLTAFVFAQTSSDPKSDRLAYYLAPNDKITIRAPQVEKLNGKTFQISPDGFVSLPSVGRLQGGGLTPQALEKQIAKRLKQNSYGEPKVTVLVVGVTAQPKTPI